MIIACPACTTKYNIPTQSLGSVGRVVRCAKCQHQWHQNPPQVDDSEDMPPPQHAASQQTQQPAEQTNTPSYAQPPYQAASESNPQLETEAQTNNFNAPAPVHGENGPPPNLPALQAHIQTEKKAAFWQGIGLGLFLGAALLGVGLTLKAPITMALTAILNVLHAQAPTAKLHTASPQGHGLVVGDIQRDILEEAGFTTYIIKGDVSNTNLQATQVPDLRVTLLDEHGTTLDQWRVQPQKKTLNAGEKTTWVCYFYNPPLKKISEYKVAFTTEGQHTPSAAKLGHARLSLPQQTTPQEAEPQEEHAPQHTTPIQVETLPEEHVPQNSHNAHSEH